MARFLDADGRCMIEGQLLDISSGGAIPTSQIGASPPASPTAGTIWILEVDATSGTYWQFVYDPTQATYKWRFVGGPPFVAYIQGDTGAFGAIAVYLDLGGPSLIVPRAGDYLGEFSCGGYANNNPENFYLIFANAANVQIGSNSSSAIYSVTDNREHIATRQLLPALTAAQTVKMRYQCSGSVNSHVDTRMLSLLPIRVI